MVCDYLLGSVPELGFGPIGPPLTDYMIDSERAAITLKGGQGRRPTYRRTDKLAA